MSLHRPFTSLRRAKQLHLYPTTTTTRPFHSTQTYNAIIRKPRPAPSRRGPPGGARAQPVPLNRDTQELNARLTRLKKLAPYLWMETITKQYLEAPLPRETFIQIANGITMAAYTEAPTAAAIRAIHEDPDLVFKIGHLTLEDDHKSRMWMLAACVDANAPTALYMSAQRSLTSNPGKTPLPTPFFTKIEAIAAQGNNLRAMCIHAEVLGRRGQYAEAFALIETAVARMGPSDSKKRHNAEEGILGSTSLKPWGVYAWLAKKVGRGEGVEGVMRDAAVVFKDPVALVDLAGREIRDGNVEGCEEEMHQAAMAGEAEGARRLGNLYLLVSRGWYRRPGEREGVDALALAEAARKEEESGGMSALSRLRAAMIGLKPHGEYRRMAMEWYEVATQLGSVKAGLVSALVQREFGDRELAQMYFDLVVESKELESFVKPMVGKWADESFKPEVPVALLDV